MLNDSFELVIYSVNKQIHQDNEVYYVSNSKMITLIRTSLWIGLQNPGSSECTCRDSTDNECAECRSRWRWTDGTAVTVGYWFDSEPQMSEECGRLYVWGFLGMKCSNRYRILCQKT